VPAPAPAAAAAAAERKLIAEKNRLLNQIIELRNECKSNGVNIDDIVQAFQEWNRDTSPRSYKSMKSLWKQKNPTDVVNIAARHGEDHKTIEIEIKREERLHLRNGDVAYLIKDVVTQDSTRAHRTSYHSSESDSDSSADEDDDGSDSDEDNDSSDGRVTADDSEYVEEDSDSSSDESSSERGSERTTSAGSSDEEAGDDQDGIETYQHPYYVKYHDDGSQTQRLYVPDTFDGYVTLEKKPWYTIVSAYYADRSPARA
jgi:hypothetical protein